MSTKALADVLTKAISDEKYAKRLATDPTAALKGYDLTADEVRYFRPPGKAGAILTQFGDALKAVSANLGELDEETRRGLNSALGTASLGYQRFVPCTGID